ncbi:transcriptional regulator, GntR family [Anaerovirgula multivorans]|uniref:Transcriptional regulator, GntR family n=1 Tax=Anaerovirgula multivorans TaxID=312168 RepID=A0A239F9F7_9FIRM|nr:PLP-dependent aminotransferase family protein [Anaerovirgula multivorans]SNS52714.1 transcriptional regulator, GntR family [Anaerovirgula multivorans]
MQDHFSEYQVFTTEEKIFITSGSQQALSILSNMPFPNGKKNILVEQPTYRLMQDMTILNGNKLIGIKRNFHGIDLKELEKIFKQESIKFFYTIPRFHNPLGTSYSEKEKMKIVGLAQKYDVYIVEDDYFIDIETNRKALPLYYYDTSKKVIYIKSFSKTFMPGIRIGAVVLHDHLKDEFFEHKRCHDQSTSVLAQGALEIFINSGMYKNHVRKIQREYGKKMTCLREFLKNQSIEGIEYFVPPTGFFIWVKLPPELNVNTLARRLKEKNILILTAKEFLTVDHQDENSFRIAISHLLVDQIRCGLKTVFEEIRAYASQ